MYEEPLENRAVDRDDLSVAFGHSTAEARWMQSRVVHHVTQATTYQKRKHTEKAVMMVPAKAAGTANTSANPRQAAVYAQLTRSFAYMVIVDDKAAA